MANQFVQRNDARLDYEFDWSSLIVDGDSISSYTLTSTGGITVDGDSVVGGNKVQYFVSDGTVGDPATVTCEVITVNGLEDCRKATFKIVDCEDSNLVIEDGTGVAGANAFITNAEFKQYATTRAVDISSYSTQQIEGAIVTSSADFISVYYQFKGTVINDDQGLSIPTDKVDITSKIKQAAYEAALLHLKGRLFVQPSDIQAGGNIKRTMKKVGSLETETEYQDGNGYTSKYPTPIIDRLLQTYTAGNGFAPATSLRW